MAYTKTNWQNSPSTATPLNATNLNHMDDGIFNNDARITTAETDIDKLENVTKYLTATAGSNGDFYVNITNTLATNMILYILFPTATNGTSNARLSINNGTTYKNIYINGAQILASLVSNRAIILKYDGTEWQLITTANRFSIFSGSSAAGVTSTINTTWASLGKFKNLIIELFITSINGRGHIIIPFELLSTGTDIYAGRRNTNIYSGVFIFDTFQSLHSIPASNITSNTITFDGYGGSIVSMYVDY